ncbi:acylphosphatase-2 [Choristoneura fumiferana]|uniref:acylphosphatase-2 n=1 Tax=Choristoneura fumiferana TaxID=7141 RepID=UPI003D15EE45
MKLFVLFCASCFVLLSAMGTEDANQLLSMEFEVYGQVQGCYFTKYCKEIAETIGIVGWVKNSKNGTIVGKIQGVKTTMDQMVDWLSTTGSPGCKIDKCDLTNKEYLARLDYTNFSIRF